MSFDRFQDRLKNNVLKSFKRAEDVVQLVTNLVNLTATFKDDNMPDITEENRNNMIKMKLWEMKVKRYLYREETLLENIVKLYGIVIGQ